MSSCSRRRRRSASVRGLMPAQERSSSVKRRGPSERSCTISTVHFEPTISAAPATEHVGTSWTGSIVRVPTELMPEVYGSAPRIKGGAPCSATSRSASRRGSRSPRARSARLSWPPELVRGDVVAEHAPSFRTVENLAPSVPWRWVVDPTPTDHRRDHPDRVELVRRAFERVACEHDEVCEETREELSAPMLVPGEPGGGHGRRAERLLDRQELLGMPRRPVVDRPLHAGANSRERIELLDRRIGPVREHRTGVEQRAKRVDARGVLRPKTVGEVAIRRRVAELDRAGDAERGEATDILRCEALCVLDALPQAQRRPLVPRLLERVERLAVRAVPDRMDSDRPARARAP